MFIATLVASACAVVVQAQTDVTSQYLKNTDFETAPVTFTESDGPANGTAVAKGYDIPEWSETTALDYPRFLTASYGITFGTLPDAFNGVNPPATDKAGNATGSVLMMSGSWGSTVILTQDVELVEGKYALTYDVLNQNAAGKIASNRFGFVPASGSAVYGAETSFAGEWTTNTVTFSLTATTAGKISIGIVGLGKGAADNAKLAIDNVKLIYYGIDKTGLTDKITEANGYYSAEGKNAAEFKAAIDAAQGVVDKADATMAEVVEAITTLEDAIFAYRVVNASPLAPVDVTVWMPEAGMDNGKTGVWKDVAGQNELKDNTSSYSGFSGKFLEEWAASSATKLAALKDFNITQTITGLPNGVYTFKAYCMATQQGKADDESKTYVNNISLYANGASIPVATLNGTPELFVVENAVVSDGTLTVGFKGENGTANWIAMDNASLIYNGFDTEEAIKALNAKVAEGDALLAENPKMQIAASQALSKALEDAKALGGCSDSGNDRIHDCGFI